MFNRFWPLLLYITIVTTRHNFNNVSSLSSSPFPSPSIPSCHHPHTVLPACYHHHHHQKQGGGGCFQSRQTPVSQSTESPLLWSNWLAFRGPGLCVMCSFVLCVMSCLLCFAWCVRCVDVLCNAHFPMCYVSLPVFCVLYGVFCIMCCVVCSVLYAMCFVLCVWGSAWGSCLVVGEGKCVELEGLCV